MLFTIYGCRFCQLCNLTYLENIEVLGATVHHHPLAIHCRTIPRHFNYYFRWDAQTWRRLSEKCQKAKLMSTTNDTLNGSAELGVTWTSIKQFNNKRTCVWAAFLYIACRQNGIATYVYGQKVRIPNSQAHRPRSYSYGMYLYLLLCKYMRGGWVVFRGHLHE